MYKKILVPLDGSKRAEMIRPHVRELAGRFQATVILLRVIEHIYTSFVGQEFNVFDEKEFEVMLKESKAYLEGIAAKLRKKGIACRTLVTFGPVVEKIIEARQRRRCRPHRDDEPWLRRADPPFLRQCRRRDFKPGRSSAFHNPVTLGRLILGMAYNWNIILYF